MGNIQACEKFGLWELVNLLCLQNIRKEWRCLHGIGYDKIIIFESESKNVLPKLYYSQYYWRNVSFI